MDSKLEEGTPDGRFSHVFLLSSTALSFADDEERAACGKSC